MAFEHRKLRVYDRALDLMVELVRILAFANPGWSELFDQLKRACTSIVLNIAEGATEYRPAEKARFYRMGARSAAEAHAALDVLERVGVLPEALIQTAQAMLEEIAAMLVSMCKQVEGRVVDANARPLSRTLAPVRKK